VKNKLSKEKLISEHAEYLYASKICLTKTDAYIQAVKKFCTPQEIAALGRLFDIEFN